MNNFKEFILNENKQFFATQCGDILNAIQNLEEEADYIGTRNLVRYSQNIANNIRNLIHSHCVFVLIFISFLMPFVKLNSEV